MRDGVRLFVGSVFAMAGAAGCGDSTPTGGTDGGADTPAGQRRERERPAAPADHGARRRARVARGGPLSELAL